jgi:hypothetical protein
VVAAFSFPSRGVWVVGFGGGHRVRFLLGERDGRFLFFCEVN